MIIESSDAPRVTTAEIAASIESLALREQRRLTRDIWSICGWQDFLKRYFPEAISKPLAPRHIRFWNWVEGIVLGEPYEDLIEAWSRGGGKCYAKGVKILMADGLVVPIESLAIGDRILSYNEESGRVEPDTIAKVWSTSTKECLTLTTASGKTLTVSEDHRILTFDGWKKAKDITLADRIASPRIAHIEASEIPRSDAEVRFVAYLICDGALTCMNRLYTKFNPTLVEDFSKCGETLGFIVRPRGRKGAYYVGNGVRRFVPWAEENGLWGHKSTSKRVPKWVFGLNERQKWMFLATLIDSDGWVETGRSRVGIAFSNQELIQDVVTLFLHVGVTSSVTTKKTTASDAWTLMVDQESLQRCNERMPLIAKADKLSGAAERPGIYSLIDTYPESVVRSLPPGVNRMLRNKHGIAPTSKADVTRVKLRKMMAVFEYEPWIRLEDSEVFWDRVESTMAAGPRETFDVEVSKNHNLIANHLVAHNSTMTEIAICYICFKGSRQFVLLVGDTQQQANKHLNDIKRHLVRIGVKPEINERGNTTHWNQAIIETNTGFVVGACGLDTAVRGIKVQEKRPDLIVGDDIDSKRDSELEVDNKIEALTTSVMPAGSPDSIFLFVQNLVHENSIMSRLHNGTADFLATATMPPFEPAIVGLETELRYSKAARKNIPIIVGGTPTWEGQDIETCQRQMNKWGYAAFMKEAQHRVAQSAGVFFDTKWWAKEDGSEGPNIIAEIPGARRMYRSFHACLAWDLGATEGGGDYTVAVLMLTNGARFYIVSVMIGQWSAEKVRRRIKLGGLYMKHRYANYCIRLPQDPAQAGKAQKGDFLRMLEGHDVRFAYASQNKALRAEGFAEAVNLGNVFLVRGDWNAPFIRELARFKANVRRQVDNAVDASSDAFSELSKGDASVHTSVHVNPEFIKAERETYGVSRREDREDDDGEWGDSKKPRAAKVLNLSRLAG